MGRKKSILFLCMLAIMALVFVIVVEQFTKQEEEISYAAGYEELQLYVEYAAVTEKINIWNADDCYYFFLPSNVEDITISFGNLAEENSIRIGENSYDCKDNILDRIELEVPYEMEMTVAGNNLPKQQVVFLQSENLPAVYIDTASGNLEGIHSDKTVREAASLTIIDEEGNYEYGKDIEYIKARGNSTFAEVDKKSYTVKLPYEESVLGMESSDKWLLLANAKDSSLIRNKLVFDFAEQYTEVPSIDGEHVDLYINGDYLCNYFLCEKVEVAENRLEITDLEEKNKALNPEDEVQNRVQYVSEDGKVRAVAGLENPKDITGGYLLEKIRTGEYEDYWASFITEGENYYAVISPENATVEQVEYIRNLFNEMEAAINQPDGINPNTGKHFSEYLSVDSWTSKYLMEEAFSDPDVPKASVYFYKDSDTIDPLIYSGPMWDYDRTMGAYAIGGYYRLDDPLQMGYRGVYAQELLQHEEVLEMVKQKYKECFLPYVKTEAAGQIAELQKELDASAKMNAVRWPEVIGYYEGWEANGEYVLNFLEAREEYLSDVWLGEEQYHTLIFLDDGGGECGRYIVKHGEYFTTPPVITSYTSIFNGWYSTATGMPLEGRLQVLEDAVYRSAWIDAGKILKKGLKSAEINVEEIDVAAIEALVEEIKKQQAQNKEDKN